MTVAEEQFRLAVLNPGGRDAEQHFAGSSRISAREHPPVNFHAYAAATGGTFFRDTKAAADSGWPILLLLRGDFRASERALAELHRAKRKVAVSLKETGAHQNATQLADPARLARFATIVRKADGCLASTTDAVAFYQHFTAKKVVFLPTPYPIDDPDWDWSAQERSGIFIGTREFTVPSRNHLAALMAAKHLSDQTGEAVTVFNLERRRGAKILAQIGFRKIRVHEGRMNYRAYLGAMARHKMVFQLDRSRVPGQVAGDAVLCRTVCVGGDGAIDQIAFPDTCGVNRSDGELVKLASHLLTDDPARRTIAAQATKIAQQHLSFAVGRRNLARFFAAL